jgi:glyoxylase-like metal-dependent hydrolase (beta-lactamase superfamily II)
MNRAVARLPPTIQVLERGWLSSNNVLMFDDGETATLIDTGYVSHAAQTIELVRHALQDRRLKRIVNTHLHSDHCGGNAALQRTFGATVAIPQGFAEAVASWDQKLLTFEATGQRCERFNFGSLLHAGDELHAGGLAWQVLAAPGHDPLSIALWNDDRRILLSADALWENGFGVIFPELEGESGFAEQRALLDLFEQLAPRAVIPGHGSPFADADAAITRARSRLAALAASPERNARQAAKALIKFLLLEFREIPIAALIEHLHGARYFPLINERYFRQPFGEFARNMVDELAGAGVVAWRGDTVVNRD